MHVALASFDVHVKMETFADRTSAGRLSCKSHARIKAAVNECATEMLIVHHLELAQQ